MRSRFRCRMVVVGSSLSFISYISNETRVTINTVDNTLNPTIRKCNRVFTMSLMSIAVLVMLKSLGFVVIDIVTKIIEGNYIRVVIWSRVIAKDDDTGKNDENNNNPGLLRRKMEAVFKIAK